MEEDGFQLVSRKKGTRIRRSETKPFAQSGDDEKWSGNEIAACKTRLCIARDELKHSELMKGLFEKLGEAVDKWSKSGVVDLCSATTAAAAAAAAIKSPSLCPNGTEDGRSVMIGGKVDIVCYGIGPFGQSLQARHQMASLQLIAEYLRELQLLQSCLLYDPILHHGEAKVAQQLGFTLIEVNEEGFRPVDCPTIFFMPHCGRSLYENVLASNWSATQLHCVSIIGNEFSSYLDRMPTHVFQSETPHLACAQTIVTELKIDGGEYADSFNDSALHVFEHGRIPGAENELWRCGTGKFQDDDHVSSHQLPAWKWER